jgi:DNA-binding response OmpR family regulator
VSSTGLSSRTILIVDDERVVALELRRALLMRGFIVPPTAGCGALALEIAEANRPEIVLMDVGLQGSVSGIDTAIKLRERFAFGLIYTTGGIDPAERVRAEVTFPAAWLHKPYSMTQVEAALRIADTSWRPPPANPVSANR